MRSQLSDGQRNGTHATAAWDMPPFKAQDHLTFEHRQEPENLPPLSHYYQVWGVGAGESHQR